MRSWRRLLALLLVALAVRAGFSAEIHPLVGDPIKGEIVSVSDKEVVFTQGAKKLTKPIKEVLKIDYRDVTKRPSDKAYSLVELTDGTQLFASKLLLKKKQVELTLLAGPALSVPVDLVANVLIDASKDAHRREWKTRVFNTRGKEAVVVKRMEAISRIERVLGEGDETGTSISFAVTIDSETTTATRKLASLHGLIFKHTLDARATPVVCKLLDTLQDVVMVSSVAAREGGVTVTTPAGAKIDFTSEQMAQLDYTKGKLEYLSDLDPSKIVVKSNLDEDDQPDQWHVYKDSNLEKRPLVVGGVTYAKGLALKPYAELVWDLKGEFREFDAVVGIDDGVSAAGAVVLTVEADGKELASVTISSDDKVRHKKVTLNVKDAQKLRVIVKSDGEFDTARHLDLADAKVRKE